jgi:peptidyl-prolyl cis-trans isomerase C
MRGLKTGLIVTAAVVGLMAGTPTAPAQGTNKVIATVNGVEIREKDISTAARDKQLELRRIHPRQHIPFLVQYLAERYLLAELAQKASVADSHNYKNYMKYYRLKALRDAYVDTQVTAKITEQDLKAYYDKAVAAVNQQHAAKVAAAAKPMVKARHILVKTEDEAKTILAQLKKGADFAQLAKLKSIDKSNKDKGGDLGTFPQGAMVASFDKAVFALKKGQLSQPVKTQYGWHVIKSEGPVTNTQKAPPKPTIPPFDRIKVSVRSLVVRERVEKLAGELRKKAKIEVNFPTAKPKTK